LWYSVVMKHVLFCFVILSCFGCYKSPAPVVVSPVVQVPVKTRAQQLNEDFEYERENCRNTIRLNQSRIYSLTKEREAISDSLVYLRPYAKRDALTRMNQIEYTIYSLVRENERADAIIRMNKTIDD
jgi:hypothetical protein